MRLECPIFLRTKRSLWRLPIANAAPEAAALL